MFQLLLTKYKNKIGTESFGLVLLFVSALLFSMMGVFLKLAASTGIPSTQLVFFRAIFQGFFVIIGLCTFRNNNNNNNNTSSSSSTASSIILSSSSSVLTYDEENKAMSNDGSNDNNDTNNGGNKNSVSSSTPSNSPGRLLIFNPLGNTPNEITVVAWRGFFGGCGFIMYFYSISVLPLGDAMTIFSLYPIHTLLLAKVFLNEKVNYNQIIATFASVIGAILIAGPSFVTFEGGNIDGHGDDHGDGDGDGTNFNTAMDTNMHGVLKYNPFGYFTALLGSVFGAIVITLIRKAGTLGVGALQLLFSWCCFGIIFSWMFRYIFDPLGLEGPWHHPSSREAWWYVLGMCFFGSCAHFLLNYAGRIAPAGLASIVRSSDIVMGYMWEVIIFGVIPTMTTIVGVIFVLLSLIIVAIQKWNEEMYKRSSRSRSNKEIKITNTTTSRSCSDSTFAKNLEDGTGTSAPTETTELIGSNDKMLGYSYNTSSDADAS